MGKHGGAQKIHKLHASINRISRLTKIIKKFSEIFKVKTLATELNYHRKKHRDAE